MPGIVLGTAYKIVKEKKISALMELTFSGVNISEAGVERVQRMVRSVRKQDQK